MDEQPETGLGMVDDRNLTAHTYNEALARQTFGRLGEHAALLEARLGAMNEPV